MVARSAFDQHEIAVAQLAAQEFNRVGQGMEGVRVLRRHARFHRTSDTAPPAFPDKNRHVRQTRRFLAGRLLGSGRYDEAIGHYEALLVEQPEDPLLLNNLAWLYQKTGNPKAREFAQRAYDLAPNQARTIDTLGWILVQEGDVNRGLTLLRFAQSRAPDDPSVKFHIAVALSKLGRTDDAKAQLESVLSGAHDEEIAAEAAALLKELSGG